MTIRSCKHGHVYDDANTYTAPDGKRYCRTCARERKRNQGPAPSAAQPLLPWEPLWRFLVRSERTDFKELYQRIGVAPETFGAWRNADGIRMYRADDVAVRLGVHPSQIWGDWYERTDLESLGLGRVK